MALEQARHGAYCFNMTSMRSIGQLAREVGMPTSTLRYYERRGLLEPAGRSPGDQRRYSTDAVERLRFIKAAQATGFTLHDITELLDIRDGRTAPCEQVESLIIERLAKVDEQLDHFARVREALQASLRQCRQSAIRSRCAVVEGFGASQDRLMDGEEGS